MRNADAEWLESDGYGGFASGTVAGERTRRYHGLLIHATDPPTGRVMLVNGFDAWIENASGRFLLSTQRYVPDALSPDGFSLCVDFNPYPWPRWVYRLGDGTEVIQEIVLCSGRRRLLCLRWKVASPDSKTVLKVRPFLSGRDIHALQRENESFDFTPHTRTHGVGWRPYATTPVVSAFSDGVYRHDPQWYRNFCYREERERGLNYIEDLASPGEFVWRDQRSEAVLLLSAGTDFDSCTLGKSTPKIYAARAIAAEKKRRTTSTSPLDHAADMYVVRRAGGKSIVAGYPWFTDWGRDTFIAMRGLCLARGQIAAARDILVAWSNTVSEGMLPNRFPDRGEGPEYNSVDASLWFVVAVHEFFRAAEEVDFSIGDKTVRALRGAVCSILDGYSAGTRFGIRMDEDGLLAAGEPGVSLTWMDARLDGVGVTPRIGKPVEVQALWLNALRIRAEFEPLYLAAYERGLASFLERFWSEEDGFLYDVVDVNHETGQVDRRCRPNQVFAVGGLPYQILSGPRARRVVDAVEARLLTPMGLRSLAPEDAGYRGRYEGGVSERDGAYHQGTVWPWLMGPFVEAWLRVRNGSPEAVHEASERFPPAMHRHLEAAGLGHVSEIADGDAPHTPRGCPFQAWSLGELLRVEALLHEESAGSGAVMHSEGRPASVA